MPDITVDQLLISVQNLIKRGYGNLPVRFIHASEGEKVYSRPMYGVQVFGDPMIGDFVAFTADPRINAALRERAPKIFDPFAKDSDEKSDT